jgi:hypothetical protein
MLRIPHCLDSRPRSTPQIHFSASGIHFCYRLSKPQGLARPQGLGKQKNPITSLGVEAAAFRLVASQLTTLPHAPIISPLFFRDTDQSVLFMADSSSLYLHRPSIKTSLLFSRYNCCSLLPTNRCLHCKLPSGNT